MSEQRGGRELWRRYLDGRVPVRLAFAGQAETGYGAIALSYFDVDRITTLLVGRSSVAKLWVHISRTDPAESLLLIQGGRLPAP